MHYAIIDENNICRALVQTTDIMNKNNMILIESCSEDYIGKRYNEQDRAWVKIPDVVLPEIPSVPVVSLADVKSDTNAINTTTTMTSEDALLLMEMMLDIQKQLAKLNPTV